MRYWYPRLKLTGPQVRNLNEEAVRDLLRAIRDDAPISPVVVFRELGAATATLLDGLHRWLLSQALGYIAIPTTQPSREEAELRYRYARPKQQSIRGGIL
jgi:hypothetical protein